MIKINSLDNKTVKDLVRLQKAAERKQQGLMIIDGAREISLAVQSGLDIVSLFYCPSLIKENKASNGKFFGLDTGKITEVSEAVFKKICYKENPGGIFSSRQNAKRRSVGH